MHYLAKYSTALLLIVLLFSSCRKEPKYGDAPEIEFNRIEQFHLNQDPSGSLVKTERINIILNFKDGNGNLGLAPLSGGSSPDDQAPFNDGSPYENNFIVKFFIKNDAGQFVEYEFPSEGFDLSGRFPRISSEERKEPLEGEIKYTLYFTEDLFETGDVIKFEVFIYDRTLPTPMKSNVVTTSEVTLQF